MTSCKRCGARVLFGRMQSSGKMAPFDASPSEKGNAVIVTPATENEPPIMRVLKKGEAANGPRYVSHFATCPNAKDFRR